VGRFRAGPKAVEGVPMHRFASLLCVVVTTLSCGSKDAAAPEKGAPDLVRDGRVGVAVVVPDGAGLGLKLAAQDLRDTMAAVTGADPETGGSPHATVSVLLDQSLDSVLGQQGYRIECVEAGQEVAGLVVMAASETGAAYGLYKIAQDLGAFWIHPEEAHFRPLTQGKLPWIYTGSDDVPSFDWRGFHEHTQHPIPASDFLLRPEYPNARQYASNLLKWMFRNRQNALTFHMLKTVNLEQWIPYIKDVMDEARSYGIHMGPLISYADQQQNAFKLIRDPSELAGQSLTDEEQITAGMDQLLEAGFDVLGFQIGSSEFTKPDDQRVLDWMQTTLDWLGAHHPNVQPYAWIHITCDLEADDGGHFYHLPLKAGLGFGAYVHTTMFYTLEHPAPVYSCQDFTHQLEFLETASKQGRPQVFFPETAWWLGFDNNMPLALPLTGWTREYDIREVLPRYTSNEGKPAVHGHATFTTGREWTYWQYDFFLNRITWDDTLTWEKFLTDLGPLYGESGTALVALLNQWTKLQKQNFLDENPEIYFYLAGELPQDEMGLMAGIIARPPKIPFRTVLKYTQEEFDEWYSRDLMYLDEMASAYSELMQTMPAAPTSGDGDMDLYSEVADLLYIYVKRIEHARLLYGAVVDARTWDLERQKAEPDAAVKEAASQSAETKLASCRAISAEVKALLEAAESRYRYPIEMVARAKPDSLTAYKFGYLAETSTAYFWTRRDDQLATLLQEVFGGMEESWSNEPELLYVSTSKGTRLTTPDNPIAAAALSPFVPQMLWGLSGFDADQPTLTVAIDYDDTGVPDPGTEATVAGQLVGKTWSGQTQEFGIAVRDASGVPLGSLTVMDPVFTVELSEVSPAKAVKSSVSGEVPSSVLVDVVVAVTAGGIDVEGITSILKDVFEVPDDQPLPAMLPMGFEFQLKPR